MCGGQRQQQIRDKTHENLSQAQISTLVRKRTFFLLFLAVSVVETKNPEADKVLWFHELVPVFEPHLFQRTMQLRLHLFFLLLVEGVCVSTC